MSLIVTDVAAKNQRSNPPYARSSAILPYNTTQDMRLYHGLLFDSFFKLRSTMSKRFVALCRTWKKSPTYW